VRIRALIKRIALQLFRDKRTLALLFVAPLLILTLMHFLFTSNEIDSTLGVEGVSNEMMEQWKSNGLDVVSFPKNSDVMKSILEHDLDGYLVVKGPSMTLTLKIRSFLLKRTAGKSSTNFGRYLEWRKLRRNKNKFCIRK
jgi:ABC-2 type transport system permease protein